MTNFQDLEEYFTIKEYRSDYYEDGRTYGISQETLKHTDCYIRMMAENAVLIHCGYYKVWIAKSRLYFIDSKTIVFETNNGQDRLKFKPLEYHDYQETF